jgi:hypothetical protein
MSDSSKNFLLASIVLVNSVFFIYWSFRVINELEALRGFILRVCPNLYQAVFACGDRDQVYLDRQKQKVLKDNEGHKDEFMRSK